MLRINLLKADITPRASFSLAEKTRLVGQIHEASYGAIQRERNLNGLIYSITAPEIAKGVIDWLHKNGHLDASKKFCDPFTSTGLLVHLANVMTGADSTGYEKDPRVFNEAVKISTKLSKLGVVDPGRIHFILGDSSRMPLSQYDVFYLLPPWEDGMPDPFLVCNIIAKMKTGAIMLFTAGIDPASIYYSPFRLERSIEEIGDIRAARVFRRIVK